MCTIGWVRVEGTTHVFKQCDLTQKTRFLEPDIAEGIAGRYLAFRREGRPGIWSGVNQRGVGFVAADYYTEQDPGSPDTPPSLCARTSSHVGESSPVDALFRAYEASIADHGTSADAVAYLSNWYLTQGDPGNPDPSFKSPDIVLIADPTQAIFLEYYPGDRPGTAKVLTLSPRQGWFVSTNHARMFQQTVKYSQNHSTYLRLARAEAILDRQPNIEAIKAVLRDQYYGETELSICRIAGQPGQYFTQATFIGTAANGSVSADYLLNGNPRTKSYETKRL
ncbi:hypothetical protein [Polyangium fumosum]|uniref:NRDE family protein n=1 Tax=Polyangium fumosum TaxID=889272 RepID=A0A4U1JCE0_9BACT|nr:hypothetical protein [Polyangium fumosum]TKD07946.1 hypothetical protein E8A74_16825 [Polyangium fumosum]